MNLLARNQEISSLAVTSALPEEGKSTVAAWYAYVNAAAGRSTLLVECDFRRPVLAERFGTKAVPGLSDYLAGTVDPQDVIRTLGVPGRDVAATLVLIPIGANVDHSTEMIGSERFEEFLSEVTEAYDIVVFDSAPLLAVGDTLELVPQVDGVLFCVRLGHTTREHAQAAKQAMGLLPEKPTGLVITGVRRGSGDDYYGYSYAPTSRAKASAS
jgi:capsular exopolysaccharide synthesis family protein